MEVYRVRHMVKYDENRKSIAAFADKERASDAVVHNPLAGGGNE